MTQIYQHEEDEKHGDVTLSRKLGIRGTFYFVSAVFSVVTFGFVLYFYTFFDSKYAWTFLVALFPVMAYFFIWFYQVYQDQTKADFSHTMWLNFISATALNVYFLYLFLDSTHVSQTF
jgi:4-hydroxybenzoate polyprenyltransferase